MPAVLAFMLVLIAGQACAETTAAPAPVGGSPPYTALAIMAPSDEETLRDNGGNVTIRIAATPRLKRRAQHRLRVLLDGALQPVSSDQMTLTLQNLDRGSHQLVAIIVDAQQAELIRSDAVTIYLHRRSLLHPNQKPRNEDKKPRRKFFGLIPAS